MRNIENTSEFRAAQLAALLARHYPEATMTSVARIVDDMRRAARRAKRFAEDCCNYDLGDAASPRSAAVRRQRSRDRDETRINRTLRHPRLIGEEFWSPEDAGSLRPTVAVETSASVFAAPADHAAVVIFGGDPRGACAFLHVSGMRGDGCGDGFAVW